MLPLILAAVGGYFIGDSMKEVVSEVKEEIIENKIEEIQEEKPSQDDNYSFADGGVMAKGGKVVKIKPLDLVLKGKQTGIKGFDFKVYELNGNKYSLVTPPSGKQYVTEYMEDGGVMAKGGKTGKEVYYVMSGKDGRILSSAFDSENEAIKRMYELFETTNDFSLLIKKEMKSDLSDVTHYLDGLKYSDGGMMMAKGGKVKVGDILTANTGVKVRVVEYDPKFGGRVRVERLDEYATSKPSQFMPLSKFK